MNMKSGQKIEMFFTGESGRDSIQKAQEYLDNPNYLEIYQGYFKKYGNRDRGARGICAQINHEVGFPLTVWNSKKPDIINYQNTRQIQEFIDAKKIKEAA